MSENRVNRRGFIGAIAAAVCGREHITKWFTTKRKVIDPFEFSPNNGLLGLQYYQVTINGGSYMGIARANLPVLVPADIRAHAAMLLAASESQ